ncbi:MAG: cysteine hydrolase family protein [Sporomusa sp.]
MKAHDVLLVVDIQNGTLGMVSDKDPLINRVNSIIDAFHKNGQTVIFIQQTGKLNLREHSKSWELVSSLNKNPTDITMNKYHGDAFTSAQLNEFLSKQNVDSIVVVGLMSQACIQKTCKGALSRNYNVTLIGDAHDSVFKGSRETWNSKLAALSVQVVSIDEYLDVDSQ